tara:strand:- start:9 stop:452 length:444 start_codon:yes stop_codon:yes gene_type:complete
MKKLILSLIIGVTLAFSSFADEPETWLYNQMPYAQAPTNTPNNDKPSLQDELPGVWWEHIPAICVDNQVLEDYAEKKGLQLLNLSFGREGGKANGQVVYVISYWVNVHNDQSMATVMTPGSDYSCVLFRTFDMKLNPYFDFEKRVDT